MGRIRSIKPEFPQSESIGRLSRDARLLFIQLWTLADDEGRLRGASPLLASLLYPYDQEAPGLIDLWMSELESESHIVRYKNGKSSYVQILNWGDHQKIDRPGKSKLPAPTFAKDSRAFVEDSRGLDEDSSTDQGRDQGEEGKGEDHCADAPVVTPAPLPKPDPTHALPDSADNRILCERLGIFKMREQYDVQKLYEAHSRSAGKGAEEAMEHIVSRWVEYQESAPKLEWQWGSAYSFLMSGKWDDPRSWPRGKVGRLEQSYREILGGEA